MAEPAIPAPSAQSTAWISRLGLMVLVWLVIGFATGAVLFAGRRGMWESSLQPAMVAIHIYSTLVSIPFIAAKIWGTWRLLRGAPPSREAPAFDRGASAVLILFVFVLYASGALLTWYGAPIGNRVLKDIHLYSTFATVAPLTWHLYRRLVSSWRLVGTLSVGRRPGSWNARLYSRRAVLALALALGLSWAGRSLVPVRASEDPNDFPVTNFGPPSASIDLNQWRLEVKGAVARPLSLSYADLLKIPRDTHRFSLDCVTGWSATRDWEGFPITTLLEMAGPTGENPALHFVSTTGYEVTMSPTRYRRPGAMMATHVAGVPFTHEHGFPVRLLVPGVVGEDNVKWIKTVEVLEDRPVADSAEEAGQPFPGGSAPPGQG